MSSTAIDLIIRHGTLIDGTGTGRMSADVAVIGDRITAHWRFGTSHGDARD